ncbi:major facilitator superfamily domain-containing protein 12 isoform X1 [Folsomia candida]|nr:major facilitator superfamily domain-containing protein 12 isoform X1 [Folsomia candida]
MDTGRLQSAQKLSYGVGHVYNDLCGTMWFTYILVYLQFVLKLPASTAGVILMMGQVVEAAATPLAGLESDRITGCGKYGRRKSTHLVGTVLTMFAFPLVFIALPGFDRASPEALLVFYIPLVLIFKFGWAMTQVSHLSMIPELSNDATDRDDMTILRYIFDMASDMSVYVVTWAAFSARHSPDSVTIDGSDAWRFRNISLILVAIGVVFNGIFHVSTIEKSAKPIEMPQTSSAPLRSKVVHEEEGDVACSETVPITIVPMRWRDWFREKHYFQVGLLLVLSRLFLNLSQAFIPLFLQEGIRAPQEYLAIIPGVCQLSALLASLLVKIILCYSTKKVAIILGASFVFVGCAWLGFDSPEAIRSGNIFLLATFLGAGTGMIIVVSTSFVSDLIGKNTESGAYVFGSIAFFHNLLGGFVVFVVQLGHGFCEGSPTYYKNFITYGLSSLAVLSLVLVLLLDEVTLGKRLSEKNTVEGREKLADKANVKKYGATNTGFPILTTPSSES